MFNGYSRVSRTPPNWINLHRARAPEAFQTGAAVPSLHDCLGRLGRVMATPLRGRAGCREYSAGMLTGFSNLVSSAISTQAGSPIRRLLGRGQAEMSDWLVLARWWPVRRCFGPQ